MNGESYCWGSGAIGQLGNGPSPMSSSVPSKINVSGLPTGQEFRTVNPGLTYGCGITHRGRAYCWGADTDGQLGGTAGDDARDVPGPVTGF